MRIRRRRRRLSYALLLVTIFVTAMVICWLLCVHSVDIMAPAGRDNLGTIDAEKSGNVETSEANNIDKAALQKTVDDWANAVRGKKGVVVYDLDYGETLAENNADDAFSTASLYKLFVVYEGYRRVSSGKWSADEPAGGTGYDILECLDLSIRKSYSPCAEVLWAKIGHDKLQKIIQDDFGIVSADIKNLSSDAKGILGIMKLFYNHTDIDDKYVDKMKDSFLNQPATEYDWRQGLPAGFTRANVYNKVGWDYNDAEKYWNIYNDAAIIEIPESNRHFVVVVMTSSSRYQDISKLGTSLENIFYQTVQ